MKPEEQLLKFQHSIGIKVQSVALPNKDQFYAIKTEEQVLDWLRNKIHNQHSAYFQFSNKYSENDASTYGEGRRSSVGEWAAGEVCFPPGVHQFRSAR